MTRKTILLMLKPDLLNQLGNGDYYFCSNSECRVVYYSVEEVTVFRTEDLRVRVGIKEHEDPIPVCYCFGFDEADLREEITILRNTSVPQRITALVKDGLCACETKNPSGICCLGEITRIVRRLIRVI